MSSDLNPDFSITRPEPEWLIAEPFSDLDLGVLLSGKEAQINLIERTGPDGESCLLAQKRYLPRAVKNKGELESLGVQKASTFRHDVAYREGRQFRKSRDRRAVDQMSTYGKRLLQDRWTGHEFGILERLWHAGAQVPYPISFADDLLIMEYVGDEHGAALQLAKARLGPDQLAVAFEQLVDGLSVMTGEGIAHGDLSAYNILWWDDRLWFIDVPQAVDIAANPQGLDFLHRDVINITDWFRSKGHGCDGEALFAELISLSMK